MGAAADALRYGGLGPNAKRLYFVVLSAGKVTVKEAAAALCISTSAAGANLNKLKEHGLAAREADLHWHRIDVTDEQWEDIALRVRKPVTLGRDRNSATSRRGKHVATTH